jgi:hypothetical protein
MTNLDRYEHILVREFVLGGLQQLSRRLLQVQTAFVHGTRSLQVPVQWADRLR